MKLTVGGKSYTQPLSLRLDPRVKTPAADLTRLAQLSREMWDGAMAANKAYEEARAMAAGLGASQAALKGASMRSPRCSRPAVVVVVAAVGLAVVVAVVVLRACPRSMP